MILKSLKLQNIRSYLNEKIEFPEGSLLLSGDVGAGKSSILHAVEFALFGLLRGSLDGGGLLRHGKKEGNVELNFSVAGKDIVIKRTLKRSKTGVAQSHGYIIIDGKKKEKTAVELKASILNLLGYPKELLTKNKSLIYRYTVYTPQEEMKHILLEDADLRLDTLRKVFGIDKYKRIRENSGIFVRELKQEIKILEVSVQDLELKQKQRDQLSKEILDIEVKINQVKPKLDLAKKDALEKKKKIQEIEAKTREMNKLRQELEVGDANLRNLVQQRQRNAEELVSIENQIKEIRKEIPKYYEEKKFAEQIAGSQKEITLMEDTLIKIKEKLAAISTKKSQCDEIKNKIKNLENCPLCEQNVSHEHKSSIAEREDKKIKQYDEDSKLYHEREQSAGKKLTELRKNIEELRKQESKVSVIKVKIASVKEKEARMKSISDIQIKLKKDIGAINTKKIDLQKKIEEFKNIDKDYEKQRSEYEEISSQERKLELESVSLKKEKEGVQKLAVSIDDEIQKKLQTKEDVKKKKKLQQWFEGFFSELMLIMEKKVMARVHSEFNELFKGWFDTLIQDQAISVRLDDAFSPVIEQNGYESGVHNLSGGEKTSCALAYRLSLNKVINDLIDTIRTKDLIILDEPTDGFSTEQLDRMRDVLEQVNTSQTIIVSHESKIESFVDNIIRVNKAGHVSGFV